jgi:hypothetical protein
MTGVTIVEKAAAGQRKQLRVFVKGLQHAALFAQIDDESKKLAVDGLTANVIRATINLYTRGGESVKGSGKTAKKTVLRSFTCEISTSARSDSCRRPVFDNFHVICRLIARASSPSSE